MEGVTDEAPPAKLAAKAAQDAKVHARFQSRMEKRLAEQNAIKEANAQNPDVLAKAAWNKESVEIRTGITELLEAPPTSKEQAVEWSDQTKALIASLENLRNQYSYIIPNYDAEVVQRDIARYREELSAATLKVMPKKKFGFKSKKAAGPPAAAAVAAPAAKPAEPAASQLASPPAASVAVQLTPDKFPGVFDQSGATVCLGKQAPVDGKKQGMEEYAVARCKGCHVYFSHPMGALRIQALTDCVVCVGPVSGAIYVEKCTGCVFVLAAHQVRIHDSESCDFHLGVGSKPIIENCTKARFGPYAFSYEELRSDAQEQGLAAVMDGGGHWQDVQDFKWLRTTQSPNWSLLAGETSTFSAPE